MSAYLDSDSHGASLGEGGVAMQYDTEAAARNLIRSTLNREYGAVHGGTYGINAEERTRQQLIDFIMYLRALSTDAVGVAHVSEADVLRVCACLKRLELIGYRNLPFIYEYVARRVLKDSAEACKRDPLHLRHLLTFSIDVPNFDMPQEEISALECHLAEGNVAGIEEWFQRHGESKVAHNKGLPSYLRRFLLDYTEVPVAAIKAYAFELAVLDVRLSGAVGWENSRCFLANLCVVQDRRHDPLEAYMDASDINTGILAHQHCGDPEGRTYYSLKLERFDPADLQALEQLVFATANNSRRDDSGPRGGRKAATEKRSWWRSLLGQAGAPAHGFAAAPLPA